jgi:hypothetical protein
MVSWTVIALVVLLVDYAVAAYNGLVTKPNQGCNPRSQY